MPVHSLSVLRWQQLPWESGYSPSKESSCMCKAMHQWSQRERLLACDNGPPKYSQKMSSDGTRKNGDGMNNALMNNLNLETI